MGTAAQENWQQYIWADNAFRGYHLIAAYEVTNHGFDRGQLAPTPKLAKAAMGVDAFDSLADRGYFGGEQILACETMQVTPYAPRPLTSGAKAQGRFGKQDFVYRLDDAYVCPAGQQLVDE
jgi:transposase